MKTVLYAEDDPDDVFFFQRAFKKVAPAGSLFVVENGAQAIAYLAGKNPFLDRAAHPLPNLVLLDINMPVSNGFEVLAWIRAQPELSHLPVVVLTSSNNDADRSRATALGANGYLVKPGQPDGLADLLLACQQYWI